jgi:large repetitive protein
MKKQNVFFLIAFLVSITQYVSAQCPFTVDVIVEDNTSCSQANGKIIVTATDGVAPYEYNIGNGFQSSNDFENLVAGDYTITVVDDNGCTSTSALTNVADDLLYPIVVIDNVVNNTSCTNPNGSIELTLSGGVAPYSFVFELPTGDTEAGNSLVAGTYPLIDLIVGAYNVEITGDNGCLTDVSFAITNDLPVITLTEVDNEDNTSCTNPNGTYTVEATGGQGDYTYTDGSITNVDGLFSGLVAGTYDVTVTDDASGCTATVSVTVGEQVNAPSVVFSNVVDNTSCSAPFNGSVQVTISGATTFLSVVAEGPNGFSYNLPTVPAGSLPLTDLTSGSYFVTVTDGNGCSTEADVTINDDLPVIIITETNNIDNTSCSIGNGTFTVEANGGNPNYTYEAIGVGTSTTGTFENLEASDYFVVATDDDGCTAATIVTISNNLPVVTIVETNNVDNTSCSIGNGTFTVEANGGTPNYTYEVSGLGTSTTGVFENLGAGDYDVTATDDDGCTVTTTVTINNNLPVVTIAETNNTDNTSCTTANGTFTVEANGGTPNYTYEVSGLGTSTTGVFENLGAGDYDVTATDDDGCTVTTTVTINNNLPVVTIAETNNTDNTSCSNSNGTFTVEANGGTPNYTYEVSGLGTSTTGVFENLGAGDYDVTATDDDGCTVTTTVTIINNLPVVTIAETNNTDNTSCSNSNGTFTVEANGGTPNYTYEVSGLGTSTTGVFENLGAGDYDVTATDDDGCAATTTVTIVDATVNPAVTIDGVDNNTLCLAPFDGDVQYSVVTDAGNFSYALEGPNSFVNNGSSLTDGSYNVADLEAGNYSITVTDDGNGCVIVETFTVGNDAITLTVTEVSATNNTLCVGGNGAFTVEANGGAPNYEYAITGATSPDGIFEDLVAGTYTVTATDDNGCVGTLAVVISNNTTAPTLSTNVVIDNTSCTGSNGSFTVEAADGTAPYTYTDGDDSNTTGLFENLAAGTYNVTVTDDYGCTATADVEVEDNLPTLVLDLTSQPATTQTAADGEATVAVSGGAIEYSYSWDDNATSTTATAAGLLTGTYNVTVTDDNGCTATGSVFVDFVVGIASTMNINTEVYPNPTSDNLNINVSLPKITNVDVELYNALGALVTKESHLNVMQFNTTIELNNFDNGVYFLKVKAEDEVSSYRVLLNK